jgi:hypothetical protein
MTLCRLVQFLPMVMATKIKIIVDLWNPAFASESLKLKQENR